MPRQALTGKGTPISLLPMAAFTATPTESLKLTPWGTHVYLWRIHFDIWQNEYNYVKFKNKIKLKKKKKLTPLVNNSNLWAGQVLMSQCWFTINPATVF